jgi:hypothetical protein
MRFVLAWGAEGALGKIPSSNARFFYFRSGYGNGSRGIICSR